MVATILGLVLVMPPVGLVVGVIYVLYLVMCSVKSCCRVQVRRADEVARVLYGRQHGNTPDLPDHLRGVFWFATNAAPELLVTFEGTYFNRKQRLINFDSGSPYSWSYSTGFVGWLYWFGLQCSYYHCAELHMKFDDDNYSSASLPLYVCGFCKDGTCCDGCWVPMGMWWTLQQTDENTWDRDIYLYCNPKSRWELGSYTLRRIIDQDGNELPAFREMMVSLESGEKIKGINSKPLMQIMTGGGIFKDDADSYHPAASGEP